MFTGEKQIEVNVVPAFSVATIPTLAIVPSASARVAVSREDESRSVRFSASRPGTAGQ